MDENYGCIPNVCYIIHSAYKFLKLKIRVVLFECIIYYVYSIYKFLFREIDNTECVIKLGMTQTFMFK